MNDLLSFLAASPSRFHAVANFGSALEERGYVRLSEGRPGTSSPVGSIMSPATAPPSCLPGPPWGFHRLYDLRQPLRLPHLPVKENAELSGPDGYIRVNTEGYGGMLCAPWLDRPLTVAGRVLVRAGDAIETRLVYVDRDLLLIPNVAIHMNREANSGYKYDMKRDMVPLMAPARPRVPSGARWPRRRAAPRRTSWLGSVPLPAAEGPGLGSQRRVHLRPPAGRSPVRLRLLPGLPGGLGQRQRAGVRPAGQRGGGQPHQAGGRRHLPQRPH